MMEYYQNRLPKAAILCGEASENHFLLTINKKWKDYNMNSLKPKVVIPAEAGIQPYIKKHCISATYTK
jgi:hypothetical protein